MEYRIPSDMMEGPGLTLLIPTEEYPDGKDKKAVETRTVYASPASITNDFADPRTIIEHMLAAQAEVSRLLRIVTDESHHVRDLDEEADLVRFEIIDMGYAEGAISGKNAEERTRGEALYLAKSDRWKAMQMRLKGARNHYEVQKTLLEDASKLLGAWHSIANIQAAQLSAIASGA